MSAKQAALGLGGGGSHRMGTMMELWRIVSKNCGTPYWVAPTKPW